MQFPRWILVLISDEDKDNIALSEAMKFARQGHTVLHLLSVVFEPLAELNEVLTNAQCEMIISNKLAEAEKRLNAHCAQIQNQGVRCDHTVIWQRHLPEAIEQTVRTLSPDLIIKKVSANTTNPLSMPMDRHLLRFCDAPMLLLDKRHPLEGPILAAIDPTTKKELHKELNTRVMQCAEMFTAQFGCSTHIVSAFVDCSDCNYVTHLDMNEQVLGDRIYEWHFEKLKQFLTDYNIPDSHIHLTPGRPEKAIPVIADELDAQVVIIGTAGKHNPAQSFTTNTAEQILSTLNCNVLALPPSQLKHVDALL